MIGSGIACTFFPDFDMFILSVTQNGDEMSSWFAGLSGLFVRSEIRSAAVSTSGDGKLQTEVNEEPAGAYEGMNQGSAGRQLLC